MPQLYDPHLYMTLKARVVVPPPGGLPYREVDAEQKLERVYNLRLYTVDEMADLLEELKGSMESWIERHPPHGEGDE